MAILKLEGLEVGSQQDLVLNFGGNAHILKDSILISSLLELRQDYLDVAEGNGTIHKIAGLSEYHIILEFAANQLTSLTKNGVKWRNRIRDKRVENCSISELLFAVRKKIKRNEIK